MKTETIKTSEKVIFFNIEKTERINPDFHYNSVKEKGYDEYIILDLKNLAISQLREETFDNMFEVIKTDIRCYDNKIQFYFEDYNTTITFSDVEIYYKK